MVDEAVDGGDRDGGIGKDLPPFAEGLVAGDDQQAALVAFGDELEEDARLGAVLANIAEVVEDQAIELVEPGKGRRQDQIAARRLELLDEVGRAREENAAAVVDEAGADRRGDVGLARAGGAKDQNVGALLDPGVASGQCGDVGFANRRGGREVEGLDRLSAGRPDAAR
jgi:hypothetical protein